MSNFPNHYYRLEEHADLFPLVSTVYEEVLSRLEKDDGKPIVLLLGEEHSTPSHLMFQVALIEYLASYFSDQIQAGEKPIVVGQERSYQYTAISALGLADTLDQITDSSFFDHMVENDPDQHVLSLANMMVSSSNSAPLSHRMLMCTLLASGVPIASVDAYTQGEDLVAYDGLSTSIAFEKFGVDISQTPLKASPDYTSDQDVRGITVRNLVKAERIVESMSKTGAKIMILPVGLSHIYGNKLSNQSYENALVSLLKDRGFQTLGVALAGEGTKDYMAEVIPDEAYVENPDDIFFENVIDTQVRDFEAMEVSDDEAAELEAEGIFDIVNEAPFIEMLATQYSSEDECPFSFEPQLPEREEVVEMARDLYTRTVSSLSPDERSEFLMS